MMNEVENPKGRKVNNTLCALMTKATKFRNFSSGMDKDEATKHCNIGV